jgi:hypothetical protein
MDAARFGLELARARGRLVESADFTALAEHGHQLRDGAVLTSVSDVPFEMSLRCGRCTAMFWFENLGWHTGGAPLWRLIDESRERAEKDCGMKVRVAPTPKNSARTEGLSATLKGA